MAYHTPTYGPDSICMKAVTRHGVNLKPSVMNLYFSDLDSYNCLYYFL